MLLLPWSYHACGSKRGPRGGWNSAGQHFLVKRPSRFEGSRCIRRSIVTRLQRGFLNWIKDAGRWRFLIFFFHSEFNGIFKFHPKLPIRQLSNKTCIFFRVFRRKCWLSLCEILVVYSGVTKHASRRYKAIRGSTLTLSKSDGQVLKKMVILMRPNTPPATLKQIFSVNVSSLSYLYGFLFTFFYMNHLLEY